MHGGFPNLNWAPSDLSASNLQTIVPDLDVVLWRHEQLVAAGYTVLSAMILAETPWELSLHATG
jgi:hypothetical protein